LKAPSGSAARLGGEVEVTQNYRPPHRRFL
jgi:hypothetical protein